VPNGIHDLENISGLLRTVGPGLWSLIVLREIDEQYKERRTTFWANLLDNPTRATVRRR